MATTFEDLEQTFMHRAPEYTGPDLKLGFYLLDPDSHEVEHIGATGVSDFFLTRYEEAGRAVDPVLEKVLTHGRAASTAELMPMKSWRSHPLYTEVCHLHGFNWVLEAPILDRGKVTGTLYFAATRTDRGPTPSAIALGETLGRLVGLAVGSLRDRHALARERDRAVAALELCDEPILVTDLSSGERLLNGAAKRLLDSLFEGGSALLIDELMAEERPLDGGGAVARASVPLGNGGSAELTLRTVALPSDPGTRVSFLSLESSGAERLPARIEGALTAREREVAQLVVGGLHDSEIAERLVISPHTVNQHLKRVYTKLGVESRVALTRLGLGREPRA